MPASKPLLPRLFIVNQVNGRLLDAPANFDNVEPVREKDADFAKQTIGEEWELRGVEIGGLVGFSDKVWKEVEKRTSAHLPYGFLTRFCYVKAKRVAAAKPTVSGKE